MLSISRSNLFFLVKILGFMQLVEWVAAGEDFSSGISTSYFDDDKVHCDDEIDGKCIQYFARKGARAENIYVIDADKKKFERAAYVNLIEYIEFFDRGLNKELAGNCSSSFFDMKTSHLNPKHFTHPVAHNNHARVLALSKHLNPKYVECVEKALEYANKEFGIVSEEDSKRGLLGLEILGIVVGSMVAAFILFIVVVVCRGEIKQCYESSQEERRKLLPNSSLKAVGIFTTKQNSINPKVPTEIDEVSDDCSEKIREFAPEPV